MQDEREGRLDDAAEGGGVSSAKEVNGENVVMVVAVIRLPMKDLRVGSFDGAAARSDVRWQIFVFAGLKATHESIANAKETRRRAILTVLRSLNAVWFEYLLF